MRRLMPAVLCLLAIASAGPAGGPPAQKGRLDKAATPEEQYRSLLRDYTKHFNEFLKEYRQAKTDVARQKLIQEKLPKAPEYAKRFFEVGGRVSDRPGRRRRPDMDRQECSLRPRER